MNNLIGKWKGSIQIGEYFVENELNFIDNQNVLITYNVKQQIVGNINVSKNDSRPFTYKYNHPNITIFTDFQYNLKLEDDNTIILFFGIQSIKLTKQ